MVFFCMLTIGLFADNDQAKYMRFESSDVAEILKKDRNAAHVAHTIFSGSGDNYIWYIEDSARDGDIDSVRDGYSDETENIYEGEDILQEQQDFFTSGTQGLLNYIKKRVERVVNSDATAITVYHPPNDFGQRVHMEVETADEGPYMIKGVLRIFEPDPEQLLIDDTENLPGISLVCDILPSEDPTHPLDEYHIVVNAVRLRGGPHFDIIREMVTVIQEVYKSRRVQSQDIILEHLTTEY